MSESEVAWRAEHAGCAVEEYMPGRFRCVEKGVKGEYYPCRPDIFDMTYDRVVP